MKISPFGLLYIFIHIFLADADGNQTTVAITVSDTTNNNIIESTTVEGTPTSTVAAPTVSTDAGSNTVAEEDEAEDEQSGTVQTDSISNRTVSTGARSNSSSSTVIAAFQKENAINAVAKEGGDDSRLDAPGAAVAARYRLYYFDFRGRGEPIRLIFHYAGEPFDDFRIPSADWKALYKNNTPYGHVPILVDLKNGARVLAESYAISRYLARKFGLSGGGGRPPRGSASSVAEAAEEGDAPAAADDEILWAEAKVDEFADFHKDVAADFHPLTMSDAEKTPDEQVAAAALAAKYFPLYVRQLETADAAVRAANAAGGASNERAGGGFLFSGLSGAAARGQGETVTWVDLMVADFFETIRAAYPRVFAPFARLDAFRRRVNAIPQIAAYLARRKPDA